MQLNEIVPWGRSLAEYRSMFALSTTDLSMRILGCGDGPASFNAEMAAVGQRVISIDPIYQFSATQIEQRVHETYDTVINQVKANPDRYVWQNFRDADELGKARLAAMERFIQDYAQDEARLRYQTQSLPVLAFGDQSFDLCLCSHLLFLYAEQLSLDFHRASMVELLRVAKEVRVFPLLTLAGEPCTYVEPIVRELRDRGYQANITTVDYEMQKGGNQMLQIVST
jgi:hypothetical protein